jgi:hypothetical protein
VQRSRVTVDALSGHGVAGLTVRKIATSHDRKTPIPALRLPAYVIGTFAFSASNRFSSRLM